MSSFFRMGRQPDTFALVVGFEGYVAASDGVPPRLETHEARVEWESEERAEDVFATTRAETAEEVIIVVAAIVRANARRVVVCARARLGPSLFRGLRGRER